MGGGLSAFCPPIRCGSLDFLCMGIKRWWHSFPMRLPIRLRRPVRAEFRCSFCGKHREQCGKLVAGPGVYICDKCIVLAVGELAKSH